SIRSRIPPNIAIQTTHVRGGTLNSPFFLGVFSSSLYLLSSDILNSEIPAAPSYHVQPQPANWDLSRFDSILGPIADPLSVPATPHPPFKPVPPANASSGWSVLSA